MNEKRYRIETETQYCYTLAYDDEDAANQASQIAEQQGERLVDVILDNPKEDTDDLDGDSLLWL